MNLLRTLALGVAMTTAVASATDQVLVLSAQKALLHASPSTSATAFSSASLAELAMDALGLGTATVAQPTDTTVSPLQADIFQSADAYAVVFVPNDGDDDDTALLDAVVDSTTFPDAAYHRVFPIAHHDPQSLEVRQVLARKLTTAFGADSRVVCSGGHALCAWSALAPAVAVDSAAVQRVLTAHAFLHKDNAADVAFATELAQIEAVTASLSSTTSSDDAKRSLFVVGFADVAPQTRSQHVQAAARQAIATHVGAFLSALQQVHAAAGAQVVAWSVAGARSSPQLTQWSDATATSRLLASLATEPPAGSTAADDDDDDDASGSDSNEDDDVGFGTAPNGTSVANHTMNADRVTLEQIAEYQIVLWTSVLLAVTLLLVILAMCNMNTGRDSLLYAKFITDANHRKGD